MRRHGWQRPLHILQILGIAIYMLIVCAFYLFLGSFLGNNVLENTAITVFSFVQSMLSLYPANEFPWQAFSVMVLFLRCSSIDPTDKSSMKNTGPKSSGGSSGWKVRVILSRLVVRYVKKMERKILHSCIRRRYTDPWKTPAEMESCLPAIVSKNEGISPELTEDDIVFCSLCNKKVKKRSKHCKSCDKCVDGFDHHCRWLNNCVGRKNYTTFMLLMASILIMLIMEGGAGLTVFIRCFANPRGITHDLELKFGEKFPRGAFAVVVAFFTVASVYASAALGQLFFFHIVLIKKGIRTYDYILAMREECIAEDFLDESDLLSTPSSPASSVDSIDKGPDKPNILSRFNCLSKPSVCHQENPNENRRFSLGLDLESELPRTPRQPNANINPWRLIKMTRDEALKAAERARGRSSVFKQINSPPVTDKEVPKDNTENSKEGGDIMSNKGDLKSSSHESHLLLPLPLERKCGPSINSSYGAPAASDMSHMEVIPLLMRNLSQSKSRFSFGRKLNVDSSSVSSPIFRSTSIITSPKLPCSILSTDGIYSVTNKRQSFKNPLSLRHKTNFDLNLTEVSTELETYISKQVVNSLFRQNREEGSPIR
eukprot:Gb_39365 [translate_table: standard]